MDIVGDLKRILKSGDNLSRLLVINVLVFAVVQIVYLLFFLSGQPHNSLFVNWLAVPASLGGLLMHPWTLLTYMFLHEELFHILFNLLVLYWFGKIFQQYLGEQKLLTVYLLGGFAGALMFIAAYNIFPVFRPVVDNSYALGASASIMAVVFAISAAQPNYRINLLFIGAVRLSYIALFYVLIDLFSINGDNPGGHLAHLGGAIFGYLVGRQYAVGKDVTAGFSRFLYKLKNIFKRKPKMRVTYQRPMSDYDFNAAKAQRQQETDRILDKIAKGGYDSLSKEEKEFLFKQGK
jgi:membrane associated rhomboid family serine protease